MPRVSAKPHVSTNLRREASRLYEHGFIFNEDGIDLWLPTLPDSIIEM